MGFSTHPIKRHWKRALAALSVCALLTLSACSSGPTDGDVDETSLDEASDQVAQTDPTPSDGAELQASTDEPPSLDDAASLEGLDPNTAPPEAPAAVAEVPAAEAPTESVAGLDANAPAPVEVAPAPVEPVADAAPISGETQDYTVRSGDTLMKIAFETYGDVYQWRKIYDANRERISDPNNIPRGTVLKVERTAGANIERNGEKFRIRQGDTLGKISAEVYGTPKKWRKIYENNKTLIKDPNRIFAGFYLYYTITPQEREEAERLKQEQMTPPVQSPPPLANAQPAPAAVPAAPVAPAGDRMPASAAPATP